MSQLQYLSITVTVAFYRDWLLLPSLHTLLHLPYVLTLIDPELRLHVLLVDCGDQSDKATY